jgi:CHAT domain-containing protein
MNYPHYEYCQNKQGDKICNTKISSCNPQGYLALEDENRNVDWIDSGTLGTLFYNRHIHLVVLSACRSGSIGGETLFSGNAPALIQAGVSAVVAVQMPVSVNVANKFVDSFYRQLALLDSIPAAVNSGRLHLLRTSEWFIPTLYLRNKDNAGYLFTLAKENN